MRLSLFVLLWVLALMSKAQPSYLLLSKLGSNKKIIFHVGEDLRFKLKGNPDFYEADIRGFDTAKVHFRHYKIDISEIEMIDIRHKPNIGLNLGQYGIALPIAGLGYLILDVARNGDLPKNTLLTSGGLIGGGFLLRSIRRKYFKVKKRNKLNILGY